MTYEQYHNTVGPLNDGEKFPEEFVQGIYKAITTNEIKLASEDITDVLCTESKHFCFFFSLFCKLE